MMNTITPGGDTIEYGNDAFSPQSSPTGILKNNFKDMQILSESKTS